MNCSFRSSLAGNEHGNYLAASHGAEQKSLRKKTFYGHLRSPRQPFLYRKHVFVGVLLMSPPVCNAVACRHCAVFLQLRVLVRCAGARRPS